jgi:hypothetical protein
MEFADNFTRINDTDNVIDALQKVNGPVFEQKIINRSMAENGIKKFSDIICDFKFVTKVKPCHDIKATLEIGSVDFITHEHTITQVGDNYEIVFKDICYPIPIVSIQYQVVKIRTNFKYDHMSLNCIYLHNRLPLVHNTWYFGPNFMFAVHHGNVYRNELEFSDNNKWHLVPTCPDCREDVKLTEDIFNCTHGSLTYYINKFINKLV